MLRGVWTGTKRVHPWVHSFCLGSKTRLRIYSLQEICRDRRRLLREQLELLWELQKIDLDLKGIKEETRSVSQRDEKVG